LTSGFTLTNYSSVIVDEIEESIGVVEKELVSSQVNIEYDSDFVSPKLQRICGCESVGNPNKEPQQFHPDGTVIRGVINNLDIGMCQINLKYHGARAEELGIDLFTREGNLTYANMLYTTQGSTPWNWSKSCWNK
jgi:hypothetical protein